MWRWLARLWPWRRVRLHVPKGPLVEWVPPVNCRCEALPVLLCEGDGVPQRVGPDICARCVWCDETRNGLPQAPRFWECMAPSLGSTDFVTGAVTRPLCEVLRRSRQASRCVHFRPKAAEDAPTPALPASGEGVAGEAGMGAT